MFPNNSPRRVPAWIATSEPIARSLRRTSEEVYLDIVVGEFVIHAPDLLLQGGARQHLSGMQQEQLDDLHLLAGQADLPLPALQHAVPAVERQVACAEQAGWSIGPRRPSARTRASQLAHRKGAVSTSVRARVEHLDAVAARKDARRPPEWGALRRSPPAARTGCC